MKEEPYAIVELTTKKDYVLLLKMIEFWLENHEEASCEMNFEFSESEDE